MCLCICEWEKEWCGLYFSYMHECSGLCVFVSPAASGTYSHFTTVYGRAITTRTYGHLWSSRPPAHLRVHGGEGALFGGEAPNLFPYDTPINCLDSWGHSPYWKPSEKYDTKEVGGARLKSGHNSAPSFLTADVQSSAQVWNGGLLLDKEKTSRITSYICSGLHCLWEAVMRLNCKR